MNNLLKAINTRLTSTVLPLPATTSGGAPFGGELRPVGNEITFYPSDTGQRFIDKGYNLNDAIYAIVSKNAAKFGQPDIYHMVIKNNERKTRAEYVDLKSKPVTPESARELRHMVKSMVEDKMPDSKLGRLLRKPNRLQSQSEWKEQLFGFRELTGEGILLFNRGLTDGPPLEMFVIPKWHINLIVDQNDPWQVAAYEMVIGTMRRRVSKEDLIMWKYPTYLGLDNPEHLRGQAPLESCHVVMQAMNEADIRLAISNKNAGAAGLLYNEIFDKPTPEQAMSMRNQVNNAINNNEMAGRIAMLAGKWGYHNLGYSMNDLKILEQYGLNYERICDAFNTPPGIHFKGNDTYENVKQYKRDWVYDLIAPRLNLFCGLLNEELLPEFDLDPETNLIDADITTLPEMAEDLSAQVKAIRDVWELSPNQKLQYWGFEPSPDPNMDVVYAPNGLTPLSELNMQTGGGLDSELNDLNS